MTRSVRDYYSTQVRQEWRRLIKTPYSRLEFATTLHFLNKYLPGEGRILDAGGGPGRYTLEMARRGYQLVLLDLTPANLAFARRQVERAGLKKQVEQIIEGSIVDLSQFADNSYDAVLCLGGPLSHVLDRQKRSQAIRELIRVAKPGAPLFISVIGRLAVLTMEMYLFPHELERSFFKSIRDRGDYPGTYGFTACHFFLPEELKQAFQSMGIDVQEMAGLEGLATHHARQLNRLAKNERRMQIWLETHFQTCTHPTVIGMSEHLLLVGKKPRAGRIHSRS